MSPLAHALRALVVLYQWTLSPFIGRQCRFEPTCSHYALEALSTHGAIRGGALTVWRLLRCNPWGGWGYDPVPVPPSRRADKPQGCCPHHGANRPCR